MNRNIPANAEAREFPAAAVIAYLYQSGKGPALIAYKGRQRKPAKFHIFPTEECRDRILAEFIANETKNEDYKRTRRESVHGLAIGDIVYSEWGYDQTNVDFYEVVRVPSARSVVVREIKKDTTESAPGSMTGKAMPKPGQFEETAKEMTRRAIGLYSLKGGKSLRGTLNKWNGTARAVTWYC